MITFGKMLNSSCHRFLKLLSLSRIRSFFILFSFLILSAVIFISCGGKNNNFNAGYGNVCADYFIDVHPVFSDQTAGQNLTFDLTGRRLKPLDGVGIGIGGNTIRLELSFTLRQFNNNSISPPPVIGVGESINSTFNLGVLFKQIPVGTRWAEHPSGTIADVIKEAVRDGYEQLRDILEDESLGQEKLTGNISKAEGNKIIVPLGLSHHVQIGDVFYIFPGGGYNNNNCNTVRRSGASLATATVTQIKDERSLLEVSAAQNRRRSIQVGDIVELSPEAEFASRLQASGAPPKKNVLGLGVIPNIFIAYTPHNDSSSFSNFLGGYGNNNNGGYGNNNNGRYGNSGYYNNRNRTIRRLITPYIKNFLTTEASDFNFRIAL